MNKDNESGRPILISLISVVFFLVTLFIFKWHFIAVALLSILLYIALTLLTTPIKTLGGVAVEKIDQGQRLASIYDLADKNVREMAEYQKQIKNPMISEKARMLNGKGNDILAYLSKNPKTISTSEHFLSYYLDTANRILDNYVEMQDSKVSQSKMDVIEDETNQSLDYLQEIFSKQLDSYYEDKILSLEVESDLLEKTVKLGGGRK